MAEWLGRGLQNLVQRFESARDLRVKNPKRDERLGFFVSANEPSSLEQSCRNKKSDSSDSPNGFVFDLRSTADRLRQSFETSKGSV